MTYSAERLLIIVEGNSDQVALETLARRRGIDLERRRISIMPIGGAHAIARVLREIGGLPNLRLAGLCDLGEEAAFRKALEAAGMGADLTRAGMEALGFYVCEPDLEYELIRSVGTDAVKEILRAENELPSFRRLQQERAHRHGTPHQQLHRFISSHSGRKAKYARLLVEALPDETVPRPLDRLISLANLVDPAR